jgi:prolyl-tRNA editing enzyme YbaK/EbsC (Cys-tRNA(Pro) deacylase)
LVGGISPFGTRKRLKIYMERTIADLSVVYINAGKRGLLAELSPAILPQVLSVIPVSCAI